MALSYTLELPTPSQLSCPQLREPALRYNIEANMSNEAIVKHLIRAEPKDRVPDALNISSGGTPLTADNLAEHNQYIRITPDSLEVPRRPRPQREDFSDYSFGTPESSVCGDNEPPASDEHLNATVLMMAVMGEKHKGALQQIYDLHSNSEELRVQSALFRKRLVAQRGRRERLQRYMLYWQKEPEFWPWEAVWDYPMRVWDEDFPDHLLVEVTSSDGEGPTEEERQKIIANAGAQVPSMQIYPQAEAAATSPLKDTNRNDQHGPDSSISTQSLPELQYPNPELQRDNLPSGTENIQDQPDKDYSIVPYQTSTSKRRRVDDGDDIPADADRYRPRIRGDASEQRASSPRGVISGSSVKGKGKMSPEKVERIQQEAERERLLQEQEAIRIADREFVIAAAGLSAEEIEEDEAANRLAESQRFSEPMDDRNVVIAALNLTRKEIDEDETINQIITTKTRKSRKPSLRATEKSSKSTRRPTRAMRSRQTSQSR